MFLRINEIQKMEKVILSTFLVHYPSMNPIKECSTTVILYKFSDTMPKKKRNEMFMFTPNNINGFKMGLR